MFTGAYTTYVCGMELYAKPLPGTVDPRIIMVSVLVCGRRGGLMVSELDSGSSGPGSSPGRGHCVLGKDT